MPTQTQGALGGAASGAAAGTAILPGWGTAAGAVAGGLLGYLGSGSNDEAAANQARQDAYNEILGLSEAPDLNKVGKTYQYTGDYNPVLEQALGKYKSDMGSLSEDPQMRLNQIQALNRLKSESNSGLNASDNLALNKIRQSADAASKTKLDAIIQNAQQTGNLGAGSILMAKLQGSDSIARVAADQANQIAANRSDSSIKALMQFINGSSALRSQDFAQNSQKSQANDIASQFNTTNSINQQFRNIAYQNQAGLRNTNTKQDISGQNTSLYNNNKQNQWNNELQRRQALSNARLGQASGYQQQAQNTQGFYSGLSNAAITGAGAYNQYQNKKPTGNKNPYSDQFGVDDNEYLPG